METEDGDKEVSTLFGDHLFAMWWWLEGAPIGQFDEFGNFTTQMRAAPISRSFGPHSDLEYLQRTHPDIVVDYTTEESWSLTPLPGIASYALDLWQKRFYRHGFLPKAFDYNSTLLMLVESSPTTKISGYRIVGFAWGDEALVRDWLTKEFTILA